MLFEAIPGPAQPVALNLTGTEGETAEISTLESELNGSPTYLPLSWTPRPPAVPAWVEEPASPFCFHQLHRGADHMNTW